VNPDLRELYQTVILDHYKHPRNYRQIDDANRSAEGFNPLCGDRVHVYLKLENDIVHDVGFVGSGCAICTASASMMTEALKGRTRADAEALFQQFHNLLAEGDADGSVPAESKLQAFAGVREFPIRVKCATLPWHTFRAALRGEEMAISTE
jgi:nitrogen fixation protein NifU and related proteins